MKAHVSAALAHPLPSAATSTAGSNRESKERVTARLRDAPGVSSAAEPA